MRLTCQRRIVQRIFACGTFALTAAAALAEEPAKPLTPSSEPQLLDYARSNPRCTGFTDLCQTCIRSSDNGIKCSTPGIACVKQAWTCTEKRPEKP